MNETELNQIKKEFDIITDFIYNRHKDDWMDYCKENRNGKQDLEKISTLIVSTTNSVPWRYIIEKETIDRLITMSLSSIKELRYLIE